MVLTSQISGLGPRTKCHTIGMSDYWALVNLGKSISHWAVVLLGCPEWVSPTRTGVAIAHLGLYTSDIGWGQWVNIVHKTVCRHWFGVG